MNNVISLIKERYHFVERSGWIALQVPMGINTKDFKTKRFAKITNDGELQFTIGGTAKGMSLNLNHDIKKIIRSEGLEVLDRRSTSGSRASGGEYPSVSLNALKPNSAISLIEGVLRTIIT